MKKQQKSYEALAQEPLMVQPGFAYEVDRDDGGEAQSLIDDDEWSFEPAVACEKHNAALYDVPAVEDRSGWWER